MVRVTAGPGDPSYPQVLWEHPEPSIDEVINLNDQGLSQGDVVDDYILDYLEPGVEVQIEPGTYAHDHTAFASDSLPDGEDGLEIYDAKITGLGDMGDVEWETTGTSQRSDVWVPQGVFVIENITRTGPGENLRWSPRAADGAELVHKWFRQPDGQIDGYNESGVWTPSYGSRGPHSEGTLRFLWCEMQLFTDNGMYIDGPTDGQAIVVGGYYARSNITNMRIGLPGTRLYGVTIHGAEGVPYRGNPDYYNWRSLWIRQPGDDLVIDECDIVQETDNVVVQFRSAAEGGSGLMTNTRIRNEGDVQAISTEWNADSSWTFNDIQITGSGDLSTDVTLGGGSDVGSGADRATVEPWFGDGDFGSVSGPELVSDWRGGEPAIRFESDGMYGTGLYEDPLTPPYTYAVVAHYDPPASGIPSPPDDHSYLIYGYNDQPGWIQVDLNREGSVNFWAGGEGINIPADTDPHVYLFSVDGSNSILRRDDEETVGPAGNNSQHGTVVGGNPPDRDRMFAGMIAQVDIYNRKPDPEERDAIVSRLRSKYNI